MNNHPTYKYDMIAVEGIDGAGKNTMARYIEALLHVSGRHAQVLSFPMYDSPTGKLLLGHLKGEWHTVNANAPRGEIPSWTADQVERDMLVRQGLMTINRYAEVPRMIELRAQGVALILDRWTDSSRAYGKAEGLSPELIEAISSCLPVPPISILLDIDPKVGRARRPGPPRDLNEGDLAKLARARHEYLALYNRPPTQDEMARGVRRYIVEASRPLEAVQAEVRALLLPLLSVPA